MVHANLAPHLHPHCVKEIDGLHECHATKSFGRWFGMCNRARDDLEKCLAKEVRAGMTVNVPETWATADAPFSPLARLPAV